jgi:hypothetical protein
MNQPSTSIRDDISDMTHEELLVALNAERRKFTKSDKNLMHKMVEELISRGVYPASTQTGMTPFQMVDGWGAYWFEWCKDGLICPHCKCDLRDLKSGPPFTRKIGISNRDSVYAWECPDCKKRWSR